MISFPNAKINLGLNIIRKREDGYHNIESCFYPIPWHDSLEVIEAASFTFNAHGLDIPGGQDTNLCVKAYDLLKADFDIPPVEIHLLKQIPMGAGLGGGSADGAFTLKLINGLFKLNLSNSQLETYSIELGSDCPFFIQNKPSIAAGRGEVLTPIELDLSGYHLAIQNPGIYISTKEAYSGVALSHEPHSIEKIISQPIKDWKELLSNDFEASIFTSYPKIASLKDEMYDAGALYTAMTGSGSTIYGIFEEAPKATGWKLLSL